MTQFVCLPAFKFFWALSITSCFRGNIFGDFPSTWRWFLVLTKTIKKTVLSQFLTKKIQDNQNNFDRSRVFSWWSKKPRKPFEFYFQGLEKKNKHFEKKSPHALGTMVARKNWHTRITLIQAPPWRRKLSLFLPGGLVLKIFFTAELSHFLGQKIKKIFFSKKTFFPKLFLEKIFFSNFIFYCRS
jgi:hypothetical protein